MNRGMELEDLRVQRLGQNHNGYHGQTIAIRSVLGQLAAAAAAHGWHGERFHTQEDFDWMAYLRPATSMGHRKRIHVSAGIHGDEPAGPLAALELLQADGWPANAEMLLLPCLNPRGFVQNQRTNPEGIDLNRDYRQPRSLEAGRHIAWLERQSPFDLYLCLHEDWESHGFYLYETNPDQQRSLAQTMIAAVAPVCPIDPSALIEGRPAQGGIIRPQIFPQERPDWPEAFYHITHTSPQGYTLEAPSDFPLPVRVQALVAAVKAAVLDFTSAP